MDLFSEGFKILLEGRVDVLRKLYIGKQPNNSDQQEVTEDDFNSIIEADPSGNKQYSQWLLNLFFWKQIKLEDLYKASEYLTAFDTNKSKMPEKDINAKIKTDTGKKFFYDSLQTLYGYVKEFMGGESEESEDTMSSKAIVKKIKTEETERIYEDSEWLVVSPKTERASCLYGKGTQWCTAADVSNNMFDEYNKLGKLYINIHKPTNQKYQFHFETQQFMDEDDEPFDIIEIIKNKTLSELYKGLGYDLGLIYEDERFIIYKDNEDEISGEVDYRMYDRNLGTYIKINNGGLAVSNELLLKYFGILNPNLNTVKQVSNQYRLHLFATNDGYLVQQKKGWVNNVYYYKKAQLAQGWKVSVVLREGDNNKYTITNDVISMDEYDDNSELNLARHMLNNIPIERIGDYWVIDESDESGGNVVIELISDKNYYMYVDDDWEEYDVIFRDKANDTYLDYKKFAKANPEVAKHIQSKS